MIRSHGILFILCILASQLVMSADSPTKDAADKARKHIGSRSGFLVSLNEPLLHRECGGAAEVYRLFILRTFQESEVIRITKYSGMEPLLTHTTGNLRDLKTSISDIDEEVFENLKSTIESTAFLDMESWPGIWRPDSDRYYFEWCSGTDYYGVEREWDDENLSSVFEFLKNLVSDE
jgi:hypothetical protein